MLCPFCGQMEDRVVDSRTSKEGDAIRRRRECLTCQQRYTSYERVELNFPIVVKKTGERQPFDRQKILSGIRKACEKRQISLETLESISSRVEKKVQQMGLGEVDSGQIGEEVMRQLHDVDQVAYVRFASVYREFKDLGQFMSELKSLLGGLNPHEGAT